MSRLLDTALWRLVVPFAVGLIVYVLVWAPRAGSAKPATYPVNWRTRYRREHRHVLRLLHELHQARHLQAHESAQDVIRRVFGAHGDEAVRVAWCESRFLPWARNGDHLGVFQMGSWERRTYGDAADVEGQARAAYRYFLATGSDWSPWVCQP